MADQSEMLTVAHRLFANGARLGAAQVLFNAAAQRQAAERRDLRQWSPHGALPLVSKTAEQPYAPNDNHPDTSNQPGGNLA